MKTNLKLVHPLPAEKPKEAIELPPKEAPPPPPFHVRHSGLTFLAVAIVGTIVILAINFFGPRAPETPTVPIAVAPSPTMPNYVRLAPFGTGEEGFFESVQPEATPPRVPLAGPNQEAISREWARAIKTGDYRAVITMLEHGANSNQEVAEGESALTRTAVLGDTASATTLLAHGASVNDTDAQKSTPLMWAASNGNAEAVRILMAHRANPNLQDYRGLTALMRAVWNGHLEAAQALAAAGARLDLKDNEGRDLRFFARESRDSKVMAFVEEKLQAVPSKP